MLVTTSLTKKICNSVSWFLVYSNLINLGSSSIDRETIRGPDLETIFGVLWLHFLHS